MLPGRCPIFVEGSHSLISMWQVVMVGQCSLNPGLLDHPVYLFEVLLFTEEPQPADKVSIICYYKLCGTCLSNMTCFVFIPCSVTSSKIVTTTTTTTTFTGIFNSRSVAALKHVSYSMLCHSYLVQTCTLLFSMMFIFCAYALISNLL